MWVAQNECSRDRTAIFYALCCCFSLRVMGLNGGVRLTTSFLFRASHLCAANSRREFLVLKTQFHVLLCRSTCKLWLAQCTEASPANTHTFRISSGCRARGSKKSLLAMLPGCDCLRLFSIVLSEFFPFRPALPPMELRTHCVALVATCGIIVVCFLAQRDSMVQRNAVPDSVRRV